LLEIFQQQPWLLVVLGALLIPILGIVMGAWTQFLWHRTRQSAYEAIREYAQQGKEPPPELLAAVAGSRWRRHAARERWRASRRYGDAGAADDAGEASEAGDFSPGEAVHREFEFYLDRRRRDAPLRTWQRAFTYAALAGGLYVGSRIAETHGTERGFLIATVIVGAVAGRRSCRPFS
jgi:hypothetical protein